MHLRGIFEKNDWKGWMYLFEGRFDDNLKGWDVLEGMFNESLERLGCTWMKVQ